MLSYKVRSKYLFDYVVHERDKEESIPYFFAIVSIRIVNCEELLISLQ